MSIEDPVAWLVNGTTRMSIWLAGKSIDVTRFLIRKGNATAQAREANRLYSASQSKTDENRRQAECKQFVLEFARYYGYMTRECMSPEELEEMIDSGINVEELGDELNSRRAKVPSVLLGHRIFENGQIDITLPYSLRDRHCYIVGRSGSGKTNIIKMMLLQDIYYGKGVGVLAPEQELITEDILPYIPQERLNDVIYVNPADSRPIAFNPLHLDEGEDIGQKVEDFVTIFKRAVGDTGFRMDQILSETLYALIRRKGSTLDDIERFLSRTNPAFRNEVLKTSDERSRTFFEETYPGMDRNAANPVLSRISAFTRRDAVRRVLCQPGQSFNFRRAMDEGKIVLFNLSDGILGEQASQLLGQFIISKIQLAAMSRADTPAALRRPFYLYLDEFQTFTGVAQTSYEKLLSRARKYRLGLVLAHQQTGQISQKLLREIFGNVTTFIAFSVSSEDARKLSQEYVYDLGIDTETVNPHEFIRLKIGQAYAKIGKTVFPLQTILVPPPLDPRQTTDVIIKSRENYNRGTRQSPPPRSPQKYLPPKPLEDDQPPDPSQVF